MEKAIGYGSDFVTFHLNDNNPLLSSSQTSKGRPIQVPVITLREILAQFRFDCCTLICDIEGAESDLVHHEAHVLARHVPLIVMEVHEKVLGRSSVNKMLHRLRESGFETVSRIWDTYVLKNERLGVRSNGSGN